MKEKMVKDLQGFYFSRKSLYKSEKNLFELFYV